VSSVAYAPDVAQSPPITIPKPPKVYRNARRVYERLLWHANGKDTCWPSSKHLQDKLELDEATVTRATNRLVKAGLIAKHQGSKGQGNGRSVTVYTILQTVTFPSIQTITNRKSAGLQVPKVRVCNGKSAGLYVPYPISEIRTETSASESARATHCEHCGAELQPEPAKGTAPPEDLQAIAATLERNHIGYFDHDLHWLRKQSADKPNLMLLFIDRAARQRPYRIQSCALLRTIVAEGFPRFRLAVEDQETPKMPAMREVSPEEYAAITGFHLEEVLEVFHSSPCRVDVEQYDRWRERTGT